MKFEKFVWKNDTEEKSDHEDFGKSLVKVNIKKKSKKAK